MLNIGLALEGQTKLKYALSLSLSLSLALGHLKFFIPNIVLTYNYYQWYFYQAHPWFKDVVWDKIYDMEAAFKPEVNGELDTQNFMKFDEVMCYKLTLDHWQKTSGFVAVFDFQLNH
jgi:hypothetical protein